ncbi:testis-expressed protein 52 [Anolis carolinensis]|uniref:testis-expressed protein 52 n=1 Tax=Anolis carolinensis TaxID=28377 RepID=UPI002F2B438E
MATWKERHFLCTDKYVPCPGFSTRAYHKLAVARPPYTDAKIKVCQKVHYLLEGCDPKHVWGYHTWLDVGRLPAIYRPRPDKPFDSNTWRWIIAPRKDSMAKPPVPPPSQLNGNTYLKFIEGDALFVSQKYKQRVMNRIKEEMRKCEQLKIRSECRAPPLDHQGNIMRPKEFKRYKHLLPVKSLASLCVQLRPVTPPPSDYRNIPCPSPNPHYLAAAVRFALKNNSPISPGVVEKYQELALSGSKIRPCTPVN